MVFIFGIHIRRRGAKPVEPRIITELDSDTRIGDLIAVTGGCPRYPGDRCDLVGGHTSVVIEYNHTLYYKIVR